MKTITFEIGDAIYEKLAKFSKIDGRSIEELAAISVWQGVERTVDTSNPSSQDRPSRLPLIMNGALTLLLVLLFILQIAR